MHIKAIMGIILKDSTVLHVWEDVKELDLSYTGNENENSTNTLAISDSA